MWMSCRAEHIVSFPAERLSLGIAGTAGGVWMQRGSARPMHAGSMILTDLTSPWEIRFHDGRREAVQMDLADLSVTVDQVRAAAGRLSASPLYEMARDHLRLLCRNAARLTGSPAAAVQDVGSATAHLVSALIVTAAPGGGRRARDAFEQTLLLRAVWYARAHLADPALDLEELARVQGVSLRRLSRAWTVAQIEFGEWLGRERLSAARVKLSQPGVQPELLADIARQCGFRDLPDFEEGFRRAVGMTPGQWLAQRP
jgi:AraC-like DNA-binding protein